MTDQIRVKVETGMLGAGAGSERTLALTPLVRAAIADGRLTPLDGDVDVELKGEALDQALRDRELSTSGTADEKRARLAEAGPAVPIPGLPADSTAPAGATPVAPVAPAPAATPAPTTPAATPPTSFPPAR